LKRRIGRGSSISGLVVFLILKRLRNLEGLNLSHSLTVALGMSALAAGISTSAHCGDLGLKDGAVTCLLGVGFVTYDVTSRHDFLAQAT